MNKEIIEKLMPISCPLSEYNLKDHSSCEDYEDCHDCHIYKNLETAAPALIAEGRKQVIEELFDVVYFANNIAKVMDDLRSSHVFFILTQAYEDIEWAEAQDILNNIIDKSTKYIDKELENKGGK